VRAAIARLLAGLVAFILIGWGAGTLWTSLSIPAEVDLMQEVVAQRTAALTTLARIVTWAGSSFVLVPLAVLSCLLLMRAGMRLEAVAVAVSLGGALLISDLDKLLVARARPPVEHLQAVNGYSFPSGHATQSSAFWFSLVLALRASAKPRMVRLAGAAAALIVAAVALSRIYLGVHYPSDVIAGVVLGTGWAVYVASCLGSQSSVAAEQAAS